jgi:hypothetical protein
MSIISGREECIQISRYYLILDFWLELLLQIEDFLNSSRIRLTWRRNVIEIHSFLFRTWKNELISGRSLSFYQITQKEKKFSTFRGIPELSK